MHQLFFCGACPNIPFAESSSWESITWETCQTLWCQSPHLHFDQTLWTLSWCQKCVFTRTLCGSFDAQTYHPLVLVCQTQFNGYPQTCMLQYLQQCYPPSGRLFESLQAWRCSSSSSSPQRCWLRASSSWTSSQMPNTSFAFLLVPSPNLLPSLRQTPWRPLI